MIPQTSDPSSPDNKKTKPDENIKPQQQPQQQLQQQTQQQPQQQTQQPQPAILTNTNVPNLEQYKYPFENLVFQGGSNKLLAYSGATKALEEAGILKQIHRMAGSGAGAVVAALLSVGFTSNDLQKFFKNDLYKLIKDKSCGQCGLCCMISGGVNPGRSLGKWMGQRMKEVSGKANLTFSELYTRFRKELCVVVTNLTNGQTEYHHLKTTPDMAVADSVRMSLASPPLQQSITRKDNSIKKVFVGGGVLCNYPVHAFDGWWLSLDPEQSFFSKIPNLETRLTQDRFTTFNSKTIGFITCNEVDLVHLTVPNLPDLIRELKHKHRPQDTKLFQAISQFSTDRINLHIKYSEFVHTANQIMRVLGDIKRSKQESFGVKDAQSLINKCRLNDTILSLVFGDKVKNAEDVVMAVQQNPTKELIVNDVYALMEKRRKYLEDGRNVEAAMKHPSVMNQVRELAHLSVLRDLDNTLIKEPRNLDRTVIIETNYVNYKVNPKDIKEADRKFLVEQGEIATKSYLETFIQNGPQLKGLNGDGAFSSEDLKRHIDDDVSEVINETDYMESYLDKVL